MSNTPTSLALQTAQDDPGLEEVSAGSRAVKRVGWFFYGFFCLLLFTFMKLPEDRIKNYIDGQVNMQLAPRGISYTSKESKLSFLFGFRYILKGVTLTFASPSTAQATIDSVEIAPSLFSLLMGKFGGEVGIYTGDGSFSSTFSIRNTKLALSFKSNKLNLGKLGLLPIAAKIQGSAILDGSGNLSGDLSIPSTMEGNVAMTLSQIGLDPQMIYGFNIPKVSISECVVDLVVDKAKATLKTFRIGKTTNPADDLKGTISGDITLAKNCETSNLNVKVRFSLSESIMKAFVLLDAILGTGKQPDGSYGFVISGPLMSPFPSPLLPNQ